MEEEGREKQEKGEGMGENKRGRKEGDSKRKGKVKRKKMMRSDDR